MPDLPLLLSMGFNEDERRHLLSPGGSSPVPTPNHLWSKPSILLGGYPCPSLLFLRLLSILFFALETASGERAGCGPRSKVPLLCRKFRGAGWN